MLHRVGRGYGKGTKATGENARGNAGKSGARRAEEKKALGR